MARLLERAALRYAQVLECPVERVRAFAVRYPSGQFVTGAAPAAESASAPFFTAVVLTGRPTAQRRALMAGFTDLIVAELGVPRDTVRGRIEQVDPDDWAIGGTPASEVRAGEVDARRASRTGVPIRPS